MSKYKAKTSAQWQNVLTTIQAHPRCIILIDADDITAWAIGLGETMAGIGKPTLLNNFMCVHAFNFLHDLLTFEANGKKLAYGSIMDYQSRYLSGDVRLAIFSPKGQYWDVGSAPALFDKNVLSYLNDNYNTWELFWFGFLDLTHLNGVFKNPGYKNNSTVCDQITALAYKDIQPLFNLLLGGLDISDLQPQNLAVNCCTTCELILDSENA